MKKTIAAFAVIASMSVCADFAISLDPAAKPIKEIDKAGCNTGIGFNGALESVFSCGSDDYWFVSNRVETARAFLEAGATLVRLQCMNGWFSRRNATGPKARRSNPKAAFDFYQANGIKAFVCLECCHDFETNRVEASVAENLEIIKWIVDNGYKGVVAGFECGNETYGDSHYADKAPVWKRIIDGGIKIWGEDIKFGINIAEFFELNPDIKHIRDRMMSNQDFKRDWTFKGAYFTAANFNKFSSQFVLKMKEIGALDKVSHVIWHAYGAESPYSCSYYGFQRFRNYIEAFPELKGKQWWLTEIRERSDEDNHCQRMFRESLIMGHYTLTALCQAEVDGFCHHQLNALSGAMYQSDGREWYDQWYDATQNQIEDDTTPYRSMRLEVGHCGAMYRILAQGIRHHPLFLAHGTSKAANAEDTFFTSARVTDQVYARRRAIKEGRKAPAVDGEVEWVAAMNRQRNRLCLLMVNSKQTPEKVTVTLAGRKFAAPLYRTVSCPAEFLDRREIPGEGKFWKQVSWDEATTGYDVRAMAPYEGMKPVADKLVVEIAPNTVQTVTAFVRK